MARAIHFNIGFIKGSKGQSPVASAAYRAGEKLHSEKLGLTFNYRGKDDIIHSEITLPDNAPERFSDRSVLWNEVELTERQANGQFARNITADLDRSLSMEDNVKLARKHIKECYVDKGMVADWSIHNSKASDGGDNPHIHIMLTMKDIVGDGFGNKNRSWNDKKLAPEWRKNWADNTNDYLDKNKSNDRVTEKSFKDLGINKMATVHMGIEATQMEKKGIETRLGNVNRIAKATNAKLKTLTALIRKLTGGVMKNTTSYLQSVPSLLQRKSQKYDVELSLSPVNMVEDKIHHGIINPPDNDIER
ncbi:MAG: MobA/MobL family protein [Mycoplasmataceae bacterium]|nr:MobA/MobL family protein [Mycoplasmataceae bacterium]